MTKKETVSNIIYDLKMKGRADFEADEQSYSITTLDNKAGYVIESLDRYIEVRTMTEARKEINKLGKNILWL